MMAYTGTWSYRSHRASAQEAVGSKPRLLWNSFAPHLEIERDENAPQAAVAGPFYRPLPTSVPWLLSCVIALAIMLPDGFFYERSEAQVPHQFRTRNDLTKTKRTRSNSRESIGKSTKLTVILPLITVWLQVRVLPGPPIFACSASYGTEGHPVSRALDIADRADVLDQGGVVYHAAAHELLADNDIKERYCSV